MSDLNESYTKRRSYQELVNSGGAADVARNDPNMEITPQETRNSVSQVAYDRDSGSAVAVKDTLTVDVGSPGVYDSLGAEAKATRTGVKNLREENGYWYGEDAEDKTVVLGRVGSDEGGLGETLGEVETFANAPVTGVMRGLVKFGANLLGGTVLDQEKVDEFTGMLDRLNEMAVGDNTAAGVAGTVGEVAGQYVAPAVGGFNTLRALGASPIVASILAESGVGLLGTSPNDENIFNLIPEDSPVAATIGEVMATDPDDPEWVNRSRNAVEALITLGAGEATARSIIAGIENAHLISKSPIVEEIFKRIDEADARLKADQEAGITRMYGGGPDTDELLAKGKQLADRLRGKQPVSVLKGDEIPGIDPSDMVSTRKNIANWYKENLQGNTVDTAVGEVRFSNKGLKKFTSSHNDLTTLTSLPAVPDILQNGEVVSTVPLDKTRKDSIVKFHRFEAKISLNGEDFDAAVLVGEDAEGNLFYNLYKEKAPIHDNNTTASGGSDDVSATKSNIDEVDEEVNLTISGKVTDTPEFKNWFGDSKVVDENGEPLVVYHGTLEDIDEFKKSELGRNTNANSAKAGFFFTDDARTAQSYADYAATDARVAKIIKEAEQAEKRGDWDTYDAKIIEAENLDASFADYRNRLSGQNIVPTYLSIKKPLEIDAGGEMYMAIEDDITTQIRQARAGGYDGVIIRNLDDSAGLANQVADHFVAFEPTQIKSIHNSGNFDPNDPRLLAGAGGLALGTGTEEAEAEEVQVASAASKFLREFMDTRQLRFGKAARTANDILDSSYAKYTDGEGIDFNFDNLNTSDEVKAQLNIVSENYAGKINDAKKGVIPLEVTEQLATLLGTDPEKAAAAVRTLPTDVEDLHVRALTMRNMLVASGERMDELARAIRDGGPDVSDADYLKFREHLVRHTQLQSQMKGVQTEIGRALSSFRIPAEGARASQITEEMLGALGGRSTAREIADRWLTTPVDRRAKFAEKSFLAKSKDVVFEIWINGLLSGLRTHQVNTVGNAVFSAWQIPERAVGATIGMVTRSEDRIRFQEVFSMFRGSGEGVVDGIRLAWKSWKDEMPTDGLAKMESQQLKAITPENLGVDPNSVWGKGVDYIGQGIRLPGRMLMAEDEFFKSIGYRMELRAQTTRNLLNARDNGTMVEHIIDISATGPSADDARRLTELREIAETRNLNKEEFAELYDISLNNPTDTVSSSATDYAHIVTFTNELGEFGQSLQRLIRSDPTGAAKVVLPFVRTPTNIIKQFGKRGPAAMMMPSVYADFAAGGARRDMALARIGVGTGVMSWAATLAMEGHITGGGPSDRKLYAAWRENNQPYSIKIGDKWIPYGRIEPIAMLFGSVADAHDFIRYSDDDAANEQVLMAAAVGVISNIGSKTFLRGIADVASAYHDPQRYGENYIANLVGTAMPFSSFLRDMNRAFDPVMRETRVDPNIESPTSALFQRVLNEYKARYPGFGSEELPPKRTFWGEERNAYDGSWPTAFNAFAPKDVKRSAIDEELVRLNTPLSMPTKRIGNTELNFEQYDRLIQLMNKSGVELASVELISKYGETTMRTAMNNLVQSQLWKSIESDDAKIQFLKSVRNDFVDAARAALAREDESLSEAMVDEMIDKQILQSQGGVLKQLGPIQSRITPPTLEVQQ